MRTRIRGVKDGKFEFIKNFLIFFIFALVSWQRDAVYFSPPPAFS